MKKIGKMTEKEYTETLKDISNEHIKKLYKLIIEFINRNKEKESGKICFHGNTHFEFLSATYYLKELYLDYDGSVIIKYDKLHNGKTTTETKLLRETPYYFVIYVSGSILTALQNDCFE